MADPPTLTPEACRAARALLGWSAKQLVAAAKVSPNTVSRVENGEEVQPGTAARIIGAFEAAGVEILNGDAPGARLRSRGADHA
jgi:transcriptional regulator with XRE-family HTH domain